MLLKYITFWWDNSCLDTIIKCYWKLFDEYFTKHNEVHGYSTRQSELFRLPDYKKNLGIRLHIIYRSKNVGKFFCCWHRFRYITTGVKKKSKEMFATRNYQCSWETTISIPVFWPPIMDWMKTTVVIVALCYRVCYLYKCLMVFVIVAFMLCYLESLILRLLSSFLFYLHPLHLVKWGRQEWNRNWGV